MQSRLEVAHNLTVRRDLAVTPAHPFYLCVVPFPIAMQRLATQGISDPRFTRPGEVVRWLGAVQAQDYLGGLWAVGLRMQKGTEAAVELALARRSIVRTWPMRGTLHFVAAEDARWMLELLTPRIMARNEKRLKNEFGIDAGVLTAARKVLIKALRDGCRLTRDALYQVLDDAGIETADSRGLHIIGVLAQERLICFGSREGKQQTFALFEEWLPDARSLPRDQALAELARRYFTGHGPATLQDFVWWTGLTVKDAKAALALAQPLEETTVDGRSYWSGAEFPARATSQACLLPAWDEFTVGYQDRSQLVDPAHRDRVDPRYGILNPAIAIGAQIVGTWKRTRTPEQVIVKPAPFAPLNRIEKQKLTPAVRRFGLFLGLPAVLARG